MCGMKRGITLPTCAALLLFLLASPASAQLAPNLLEDPGFEGHMGEGAFSGRWTKFGRAFCEAITARSGTFVAKIFGNFEDKPNWSGVFQDVPAQADRRYVASAHLRQNTGDSLSGKTEGWIKLEFYDAKHAQLKSYECPVRLHGKSGANRWLFFTTGPCLAPPGTAWARLVAIVEQGEDNGMGSVLFDDAELKELP